MSLVYRSCVMPSITITVSTEAHARLKKLKQRNESFSEVILREVPEPPARTAGELLDMLEREFQGKDLVNEQRMRIVERGRKRRSKRSTPHAA